MKTVAEKKALERFDDEVIDRLFALDAKRAAAARVEAAEPAKAKGGRKKGGDGLDDLGTT